MELKFSLDDGGFVPVHRDFMYLRLIAINPTVVGEIAGERRAKSQRPSERGNRAGTTKIKATDLGAL